MIGGLTPGLTRWIATRWRSTYTLSAVGKQHQHHVWRQRSSLCAVHPPGVNARQPEDYEYFYLLNGGQQPRAYEVNPADDAVDVIAGVQAYNRDSECSIISGG